MEQLKFSNNQLRKLGKELRTQDFDPSCLETLDSYRRTYKVGGKEVYEKLILVSRSIYNNPISTYRVKRINSIITKLVRLPNRQLDKMWDIAGCRCVVRDLEQVYKIKDLLSEEIVIRKVVDYYKVKNDSGYKSLHLYVESPSDNSKLIEIQIRTEKDHRWATLVEIFDLIYDVSIKEGAKDGKSKKQSDLEEFMRLLESDDKELSKKILALDIIVKYDIFNKLLELFKRNYFDVRRQYAKLSRVRNSFFIIETDEDYKPELSAYYSMTAAEDEYFTKFTQQENKNFVLISISNPSLENLEKAYSNYILTRHKFIDYYFNVLGDVLIGTLGESQRIFKKTYHLYQNTLVNLQEDFNDESAVLGLTDGQEYNAKKVKYWEKEFVKRFGKRKAKVVEINKKMSNKLEIMRVSGKSTKKYEKIINTLKRGAQSKNRV